MSRFWRLTPTIALTAAAALLLAGVLMALYNERGHRAQQINEATVQAQILASTVTAALAFEDEETAQEYLDALGADPNVRGAAVYDGHGLLFARFAAARDVELPETVDEAPPRIEDDKVIVMAPVRQGDTFLGTVYLETLMEPVGQRLARYAGVGLLIVMASLVFGVLAAAHAAMARANAELERRAVDLADANRNLLVEILEREKAEDALRQSQKMEAIGKLSGGIAHDFNNLLTVVRGNLQLLHRRVADGRTDVQQYVALAMDGLERASSVTQRILAFSRRQPLSPISVDLNDLIAGMRELLGHSLGEQITIDTRLGATWRTLCDPNQMENVVLNLVINARDAMPDGGRLTIETVDLVVAGEAPVEAMPAGDYVRLAVRDTGIGMSDEILARAIDPFFTTKPQGQGTGLGLSMIFGYVTQSNGHLQIESTEGRGTTVSIYLPRHDELPATAGRAGEPESPAEPAPAETPAPPAAASAPTVLVVEDEALVRMLAVETLRDAGYAVAEEGDGSAALEILSGDHEIDLLVTDIKLPGINGYQLAEAGMAQRPGLKVLLMTGFSQDPVPERLSRAGVKVLYKPYNLDDLTAHVNAMLRDRPAEDATASTPETA